MRMHICCYILFYALSCPQRLLRLFQTREKSLDFYNCKLLPQGVPGSNPGSVKHFFHYFYHFLPENAFWYAKTAVLYENTKLMIIMARCHFLDLTLGLAKWFFFVFQFKMLDTRLSYWHKNKIGRIEIFFCCFLVWCQAFWIWKQKKFILPDLM